MDYEKLMLEARQTNRERDAMERDIGVAAVSDAPFLEQLRTVMAAIQAGIVQDDWTCIAEAQGMLEDLLALFVVLPAKKRTENGIS